MTSVPQTRIVLKPKKVQIVMLSSYIYKQQFVQRFLSKVLISDEHLCIFPKVNLKFTQRDVPFSDKKRKDISDRYTKKLEYYVEFAPSASKCIKKQRINPSSMFNYQKIKFSKTVISPNRCPDYLFPFPHTITPQTR